MRATIEDTAYGICPAPLKAQAAINILCDYLLGEDWYVSMSIGVDQVNTCIVEQILDKYSKGWKKDWKYYTKTDKR